MFGINAKEFNPTRTVFVVVARRDRATLERIISRYCHPGTTVMSDEWRGYVGLGQLGYNHLTVNHSRAFVNQVTGNNTFSSAFYS